MDEEMQKNYFHSVPKRPKANATENTRRLSIVFRTGDSVRQSKDHGSPCLDLSPQLRVPQVFGNRINGLREGHVYTRAELFQMGAHRMLQRGISGNVQRGADALIVSGLREDKLGEDSFLELLYAVEKVKGGASVVTSYERELPVRVFRSSTYNSPYRAVSKSNAKGASKLYRYDGLYKVVNKRDPDVKLGPYNFELVRIRNNNDLETNDKLNLISNKYIVDYCRTELGTIHPDQ